MKQLLTLICLFFVLQTQAQENTSNGWIQDDPVVKKIMLSKVVSYGIVVNKCE